MFKVYPGRAVGRYLYMLGVLCALGVAPAQDGAGQALFEAAGARFRVAEVSTVDQVLLTTLFDPDGVALYEARTHLVADLESGRLLEESYFTDEPVKVLFENDEATLTFVETGATITLPRPEAERLRHLFNQPQSFFSPDTVVLRHNGRRAYAGLVEGEEVEIETPFRKVRLLLGSDASLLGVVSEEPGLGPTLLVPGKTVNVGGFPMFIKYSIYELEGDKAVLVKEVRVEDIVVNAPLDEALFD